MKNLLQSHCCLLHHSVFSDIDVQEFIKHAAYPSSDLQFLYPDLQFFISSTHAVFSFQPSTPV